MDWLDWLDGKHLEGMSFEEWLDYNCRCGPDHPPDECMSFLFGKEIREKYPEFWKAICKLENYRETENLDRLHDIQLDCPSGFTHLYTNEDITAVVEQPVSFSRSLT